MNIIFNDYFIEIISTLISALPVFFFFFLPNQILVTAIFIPGAGFAFPCRFNSMPIIAFRSAEVFKRARRSKVNFLR